MARDYSRRVAALEADEPGGGAPLRITITRRIVEPAETPGDAPRHTGGVFTRTIEEASCVPRS